ncbi:MAG: phage antirepressor protein [Bacteroides sp.]|nr:phage antirepressor protein [Bacteroides sp.]
MANPVVNLAQDIVESKSYDYNGNNITFNKGANLMVNATEMAKPFGKRPNDFLSAKSTQELICSLSAKTGIPATALVIVNQGGNNQGTWLHEDLALIFAQWLSPTFYLWCNDRIKELLQVGMTATPATLEAMIENPDLIISLANRVKELRAENVQKQKLLAAQNQTIKDLNEANAEMRVKVSYYDQILASKSTVTTTQIAQDYGMSAKKFNVILRNLKIQRKVGGQWILYSPHNTMGYVHSDTFIPENSVTGKVVMTTKWTQKGRLFLYETLKRNNILPTIEKVA